jgi:N-methylhydantoinase A
MTDSLRVGIDVGGTFTKAVAVEPGNGTIHAMAEVPTSHTAEAGVSEGVASVLGRLLAQLGGEAGAVEYVAFSTTQAMNALLEGDVARVGVIGLGRAPDLKAARKRTHVGAVALAPGRELETEHEFIDATKGLAPEDVDAALDRLTRLGCEAIAVSGAFAVDGPEHELLVSQRARERGIPCCCGHDLTGAYGLETRTVSAAVNAAILPVIERTAGVVERAMHDAGIDVPLLVLRGDGGAMGIEAFRRRPSFTVGSGPAAGVAAALQALGLTDAIVIECGGTSTNVSVIRGGRPVLRSIRVMGRPTAIRSVDSWVVGAAGGSMARVGRRRFTETGPRSAHVAGLPYACFATAPDLAGAEAVAIAPREGDPQQYAVVRAGGREFALTSTCAANALGIVAPGSHASGDREAALVAFEAAGKLIRRTGEQAARWLLDGAVDKIAQAAKEAAETHKLGKEVPLVALGGSAEALVPEVAAQLGRSFERPENPEVLSAIGAAMSLIRAEVTRSPDAGKSGDADARRRQVAREAELECVAAGAAPASVTVETHYDVGQGVLRAIATGATALETGAAARPAAAPAQQRRAASDVLAMPEAKLHEIAASDFYRVFSGNGSGRVAIVDSHGGIAASERKARNVMAGEGSAFIAEVREAIETASVNLGIGALVPRVTVICGSQLSDLSDARSPSEVADAAERLLREHGGQAVAVVAR